ncbi:GWxTD domain-containing protein, partial [candidate division KSB1 bacterium]
KSFEKKENLIILGLLHKELKNFDNSEKLLKEYLKNDSTNSQCYRILSDIAFKKKDHTEFTNYYYKTLDYLDNEETLNEIYLETEDIMSENEKKAYLNLSDIRQKRNYLLIFWKKKDPDIFTFSNERLVEHFNRLEYARKFLRLQNIKGYDERGEIYIKYGEPLDIFRGQTLIFNGSIIETRSNESWTYFNLNSNLSYDFVEFGAIYREVDDLSKALLTIKSPLLTHELYKQRSYLGSSFMQLANSMDFDREIIEFKSKREIAKNSVPDEYYFPERKDSNINFLIDHSQFKGEYDRTILFLYSGIAGKYLDFKNFDPEHLKAPLNNRIIFIDSLSNRAVDVENHKALIRTSENFDSEQFLLDINKIILIPGNYIFGIEYYSEDRKDRGFSKKDIQINKFSNDALQISDILLAYNYAPENAEQKFQRNDINLIPMPYPVTNNKRKLGVYFEIYNLEKDDYGEISYEITYDILKEQENRSFVKNVISKLKGKFSDTINISSSFIRDSEKKDEGNFLFLDINTLNKGRYILNLKVRDLSDNEITETSKKFIIVNGN